MFRSKPWLLAVSACLLAAGCADSETTPGDVMQEAKEAAATAGQFVKEQVQAYRQAMEKKLDEMQPQLQQLQARAKELAAQGQDELAQRLMQLEAQRVALVKRVAEAKATSGEAWADVQRGLDQAWKDLEAAFAQALTRFGAAGEAPAVPPATPAAGETAPPATPGEVAPPAGDGGTKPPAGGGQGNG